MKSLKIKGFALLTIFAATSIACSIEGNDDNYCYTQGYTGIDSVTGPDSTAVGEPIEIEATFKLANGCASFVNFAASNAYPKQIVARVDYNGCTCPDIIETVTETYTFEEDEPGTYMLRFIKPNQTFIIKSITVTE